MTAITIWSNKKKLKRRGGHRTRTAFSAVSWFYDETLRSVGLRATQLAVLVAVDNEDVMSVEGGLTATAHKRRASARRSRLPIGLMFGPRRTEEAANTVLAEAPKLLDRGSDISIHD